MSNIHFVDGNTKEHLLILNSLGVFAGLCTRNSQASVGWQDRKETVFEEYKGEIKFENLMCKAEA